MKTESVIKLPVEVKVMAQARWSMSGGRMLVNDDGYICAVNSPEAAHAIARALNTQPQLLEACKTALAVQRGTPSLADLRALTVHLQSAIAAAEKESYAG